MEKKTIIVKCESTQANMKTSHVRFGEALTEEQRADGSLGSQAKTVISIVYTDPVSASAFTPGHEYEFLISEKAE